MGHHEEKKLKQNKKLNTALNRVTKMAAWLTTLDQASFRRTPLWLCGYNYCSSCH